MAQLKDKTFFGEYLAAYPDNEAIADGVLIDTTALNLSCYGTPVNRFSSSVWSRFYPVAPGSTHLEKLKSLKAIFKCLLDNAGYHDGFKTIGKIMIVVTNKANGLTIMEWLDY